MQKTPNLVGTSAFWILLLSSSIAGLVYLAIWSFHNSNVGGLALTVIFVTMIFYGILVSKGEIFSQGMSWGRNCLSFTIGFFLWLFVSSQPQSVLALSKNALFESISTQLPLFFDFIMTGIVIPISEEIFWMVAIPFTVLSLCLLGSKKFPLLANKFVQLLLITAVSGLTFAVFHVGKFYMAFLIVAFIFRAIMVFSVYGDKFLNWIPFIDLVLAFSVGSHIGNNIAVYGWKAGFVQLTTNGVMGYLILGVFIAVFLSGINEIISAFRGKAKLEGGEK